MCASFVYSQQTFLDNFSGSPYTYANNNGTNNFSSDWIEGGDDNSPNGGNIRVVADRLRFQNLDNRFIYRQVPLAGASSATFTLDYDAVNRNGENLLVFIWNPGANTFNQIANINTSNTGSISYNLTAAEIASNPRVLLYRGDTDWPNNARIFVDNVQFSATFSPQIIIDDFNVNESDGSITVTARHEGANASGAFTVNYTTVDGSANAGSDYTATSGTLSFNGISGDTDTITIPILNNPGIEFNETLLLQFTASSDGSVDFSDTATGTIIDPANNPRPYEERFAMNLQGNFKMLGNTNLQCVSGCPATPTTNNPSVVMGYADIDGIGSTVNSSSSNLTIPAGATITYAGLYWGGLYNSGNGGITNPSGTLSIDQVKFRTPTSGAYSTIAAEARNIETGSFSGWDSFMAHADVTSMVQSGGNGNYFIADLALATGSSFTGPYGGWTMVVIYDDPSEKSRNISLWDGFDFFGFGANDSFTVTGLLTPTSGTFETHAGYFGFDGEASSTGDFVSINGTALSNGLNPNNNTLNGTISEFGVDVGGRNPSFAYSWGIDIDVFDATGLVPNSATDMNVVLGSSSEGIWGGVFVTSNEIAFPTVANIEFSPSTIDLGEESTVTITIDNPSNGVSLTNFELTNTLPSGMVIAPSPDATSSCGGTIFATSGNNSFFVSGVAIPAGSSCSFTFDVTTNVSGSFANTIFASDVSNDQNIPLSGDDSATLTVNTLPDNDNDGIDDISDLDDDNDGILDTVECGYSILWVLNGTAGPEEQNVIDKLIAMGHSVTVVDDNVGDNVDNFDVTFLHEDVFSGTAVSNMTNLTTTSKGIITSEQALHDEILGGPDGGTANSTFIDVVNTAHPITENLSLGNYTIGDAGHYAGNLTSGTVLANHSNGNIAIAVWEAGDAMETGNAPGRRAVVPHSNDGAGLNTAGEDLLVKAILWTAGDTPLICDTDLDGIINSFDTDSDNDGCNDANEAYSNANTDSDDNGMFGSGMPTVNLDGTVAAATYQIPADNDSNGIYDFLENGTPSINSQPVDINICPGCTGSFTVTAIADTYQWQLFNGTSWDDLSDGGIFNGTTTGTLTLTGPTISNDGDQFRVMVSNSSFVCATETSNTANLTIAVSTVITNRRITYRVNKN
ncbi:MAG: Calx-beta domain-containing protein [Maribacter sp.]